MYHLWVDIPQVSSGFSHSYGWQMTTCGEEGEITITIITLTENFFKTSDHSETLSNFQNPMWNSKVVQITGLII
jgi:hypothetical protein